MFATKPDTSKHSTTKRNVTLKRVVVHVVKSFLSHLALISLLLHQVIYATALAENLPITPDGSTNTQVTKTDSGIDQVNIAAPNSSGLSHNKFTDYNINRSGQIINNFSGKNPAEVAGVSGTDPVTSTRIGGLVTANPNLANSGSAAIILNEVTSTNNSQLLGYAEIAGSRAELIISNPNGITCSGCGFINTSRLSLIAGRSSLDPNGNLGFNLKEQANPNLMIPLITVEGLGLDVERATHADIVASAIKLIATIYGSDSTDVTLKVGEGGYNYSTKNIDQKSSSSNAELFAIDASNLGAIQAGRIFIIATKEGFGVKLDARLDATKTLNIDTLGNLYYTSLNARDQVNLKAKNIYSNNVNSAIKSAAIEVSTSAEFKNLGRLTASKINISNSSIFNNSGITEALNLDISSVTDVTNYGTIFAQNSLGLSAVNLTNKSSGMISSTADYTLVVSNLLTNYGVIYSPTNLTSRGGSIINSGKILAEEKLTLNLAGGLTNFGDVQSNGNFTLTAPSLDNSGSIKSFSKSTINVAAISNNVDAVIFSQGDAEILQNNILTNYGHILSAAKMNLDGKVLGNNGEIYAAADLDFSLTTSLDNRGSLSALADLTLKGTSTITNFAKILSGGVFTITAASLTNSDLIQSANNLTLNLQKLTNSKSILAQNNFAIKGASSVNNNGGLIQSGEGFSINSSVINNELGQFISSATIMLNLGANDYSITGNILAKNIEINAANITNLGNVNAVEYLKLTASGGNITNGSATSNASNVKLVAGTYLELTAQNYITNYTIISAKTNLTLSATNADINNYGQITGGSGSTTLNAITINNYKSGNASFSSKITSKNDIFLNAANLVNNSKIESANNLTANISADLTNNSGGFIYANNVLTFNIKNNFTNNRTGVIQSLKALTIQGSTPNSKLNQFQNISASIESLQGDITIFAKEFSNKRAVQDLEIITLIKTAANKIWYEDRFEVYDNSSPGNNLYRTDHSSSWGWAWFDFSQPNLPYRESYRYDVFGGDSYGNGIIKTVATRREAGSTNLDSVIKAGGMFTAYSDNFTNQNGQILAVGNVTINTANFNNKATAIYQTINDQCVAKNHGACYRFKVNSNGTRTLIDSGVDGHIFSFEAISSFISANIKSGTSLTINATNTINNGDNQGEVLKDSSLKATTNTHISDTENSATTTINPLSSYTPESAFISTIVKSVQDNGYLENIGDIAATIAAQSDLEKSSNPNAPVYESRSEFTDMSTFCSSSCLWARIKDSLEAAQRDREEAAKKAAAEAAQKAAVESAQKVAEDSAQKAAAEAAQVLAQESASKIIDQISSQQNRFFGDAVADRKLIEKQLQQIYPTDSFQSYDSSNYINNLMNNSVDVATDLQLSPGITLTKEQIENLTKDIIWIEPINMPDGTVVLAPKVYLSKTSRNNILAQNARAGATLSAKDIVISGDPLQTSLTNYGSIIAGNNLSIVNIDNLTQSKNSLLTAMNDLNLSLNSNLLNYGTISTTGNASNLSLTSLGGNLTNKSTISSANNLNITAANDIKNIGAEISAINNLSLKSLNGNILNTAVVQTNDANLLNSNSDSYQLRFGDGAASGGNIYSNLVQNASLKGGNIDINAAGNFTNSAASVAAAGDLSIIAGNDINIDTLKLHNHSESSWGNGRKGGTSVTDSLTNIGSNIKSSGTINLTTTGVNTPDGYGSSNINIVASNLTTMGSDINIIARDQVNIISAIDTYHKEESSHSKGLTVKKSSISINDTITNIQSNISNAGNLTITSGSDTNIIASNLSGQGSGTIIAGKYLDRDPTSVTYNQELFNSDAQVNILNGVDTTYDYSHSSKTKIGLDAQNLAVAVAVVGAAAFTGGASLAVMGATSASYATTVVDVNKSKSTSGNYSEKIVKSNLTFGGDINIASASDLNIRSSKLSAGVDPFTNQESGKQGDVNLVAGLIATTDLNSGSTILNTNEEANVNITSDVEKSYSFSSEENSGIGGSNIKPSKDGVVFGQFDITQSASVNSKQVGAEVSANNGNVNIISQKDLNITASNVNAVVARQNQENNALGNVNLISNRGNVNIVSAYDTSSSSSETSHGDLGLRFELNSHEAALKAGIKGGGTTSDQNSGTVVSSSISGSAVNISSGLASIFGLGLVNPQQNSSQGNININSSNISSLVNSVFLASANNINLTTSSNFSEQSSSKYAFDAHVRLGVNYNFKDTWKSVEALKDVKLRNALKYATINAAAGYLGAGGASTTIATLLQPAVLSGKNGDNFDESLAKNQDYLRDANTINNAGKGGSGGAGLTVELSYSASKSGSKETAVIANNIFSNADINLVSKDGDLNINSSFLTALNNISLDARQGNINITADASNTDSFSRDFALSVSIPLVGKGGSGSIYFAKSKAESASYLNSKLSAGNKFISNSKLDTNIISSNILASDIDLIVGGNLNLESKQNTASSKAMSLGIGGGYSQTSGTKSVNGNLSYSQSKSNRSWVDDQASIIGLNHVTINVGKNTNLIGSVIANSTNGKLNADGIDGGNLTLNTNSLSFVNLADNDSARNFGIGLSGGNRSASGDNKGSGSGSVSYSMHDYEQNTNATIGSGTIKIGTRLNLDSNNNLLSVSGGEISNGNGINRNLQLSQVTTKHLSVDPITLTKTFEWGRNSVQSQKNSASNKTNSSKPKATLDEINNSKSETLITSVADSIKETADSYQLQINPLRGFSNITDGIVTDLRNMKTELGIRTFVVNVGESNQYKTIALADVSQQELMNKAIKNQWVIGNDQNEKGTFFSVDDGRNTTKIFYTTGDEFTLDQLKMNPELSSNNLSANGVMNNLPEASRNAVMQLGGFDEDGRLTLMFDPSAKNNKDQDSSGNGFGSLLKDLAEVSINYLGAGIVVTNGQKSDQEFLKIMTDKAKSTGDVITLSGHSAGGRRNYISLLNSEPNQYLDDNGRSVLQVQSYGTPANNYDLQQVAKNSGATYLTSQNNSGDFVGNVLGPNGNIVEAALSAGLVFNLFELPLKLKLDLIYNNPSIIFTNPKSAFDSLKSPHSDYYCLGSECNYNNLPK